MATKAQQKKLMSMAKTVLTHRRNGNVAKEQAAWERLDVYCRDNKIGYEAGEVIGQAIAWLL